MKRFFSKEIPNSPVYVNGSPFIFDFLETEDPSLIRELDNCVRRGVGGVVSITEDQFREEVKKKANGSLSGKSSNRRQARQELSALRINQDAVAKALGRSVFAKPQQNPRQFNPAPPPRSIPDPIEVPTPESFQVKLPPTAKLKEVMAE